MQKAQINTEHKEEAQTAGTCRLEEVISTNR